MLKSFEVWFLFVYLYSDNNKITITMENLVSKIKDQSIVKEFGITEAFFFNGEFYTTSNYQLPYETIEYLENELRGA
jgi:hypothetical protein